MPTSTASAPRLLTIRWMVSNAYSSHDANVPAMSFWRRLFSSRSLVVSLILAAFAGFLYLEQDWSGKKSWQKHKRELEARGQVIDWNAFIPETIPDDQNIFSAPKISDWFIKGGPGQLNRRLSSNFSSGSNALARPIEVARFTFLLNNHDSPPPNSDLVLSYDSPNLTAIAPEDLSRETAPEPDIIPLIVLDEVPLTAAISNLARTANLSYTIDPDVFPHKKGKRLHQPYVSLRWENVTAIHALKSLLENHGLALVTVPKTPAARIVIGDRFKTRVFTDPETRKKIIALAQRTLTPLAEARKGVTLKGSQGFTFVKTPLNSFKPFQILVRADEVPDSAEVAAFFPAAAMSSELSAAGAFEVKRTGTNTFSAVISPNYYDAEDYLAWSDQFETEFDTIREALKRPSARMDGNYRVPFQMPVPNFIAVRMVAQTLAQRAQCSLLLGEPDEALHDLTLLHDLSRLLDPKPSGKTVTLVAAMINVAVTGVYVEVISDGLRLHAWQQPQLAAIEKQLREVDLPPLVSRAFNCERAAVCQTLESVPANQWPVFATPAGTASLWQKIQNPRFWLLSAVPRGWIYDNMTTIALMDQKFLDSFDANLRTIRPHDLDKAARDIQKNFSHVSPANFLAQQIVPNYSRAWQATAMNQTKTRQALLACALERYRLANSKYPDSLNALAPAFLEELPADLIAGNAFHYTLKADDRFLLYSVGWNETDDGGLVVKSKSGVVDSAEGDWVWQPDQSGT